MHRIIIMIIYIVICFFILFYSKMEASSRDVQGQGEDSMKVYYRGMSLAMNALFGSRAVVQGQGKSMEVFREGICLVINSWWPIRAYVKFGGGGPQPELRLYRFCDRLFSCFIQSKDQLLCIPLVKIALKDLLTSFAGHPLDNSTEEVISFTISIALIIIFYSSIFTFKYVSIFVGL